MSGITAFERWLAPGLLVGVAVVQIIISLTQNLTPWKGGGFGMFASTDSLSMRVVSCEALTSDGREILVDALDAVGSDRRDTMRSMPSKRSLVWLGHLLLDREFVPESARRNAAEERLKNENPDLDWSTAFGDSRSDSFYRPIRASDPDDVESATLSRVKLQWWRVSYDGEGGRLRTTSIGEPVTVELRAP
ncbi:MAG: hypothetical protein AAGH89_13245 [Verrucomicrobiota bacterium]